MDLKTLERAGHRALLGTGDRELLQLVEEPGARPAVGYTGLYHFALLVPERADLARWLAHAARDRLPIVGLSDHFVSGAIYLSDDEHARYDPAQVAPTTPRRPGQRSSWQHSAPRTEVGRPRSMRGGARLIWP